MAKKGVPKRDSSGRGTRANKGRGGCKTPRTKGKKPKGWEDEPARHSLAAHGVKTKGHTYAGLFKENVRDIKADTKKMFASGHWDEALAKFHEEAVTKEKFEMKFKLKPGRWGKRTIESELEGWLGGDAMDLDVDYIKVVEHTDESGVYLLEVEMEGTALSHMDFEGETEEIEGNISNVVEDILQNNMHMYPYDSDVDLVT